MAKIEIKLPAMGEGIIEATLSKKLVAIGAAVEEEQSVVEVATDKVDSEVPSTVNGIVEKYFYEEGDIIAVGETILIIQTDGPETADDLETFAAQIETEISETVAATQTTPEEEPLFLSPLVRSIIKQENISANELKQIKGSGKNGRYTKADLLSFLDKRKASTTSAVDTTANHRVHPVEANPVMASNTQAHEEASTAKIQFPPQEGTEIIEMNRMRRVIADHMVSSLNKSPHVTSFVEVDLTSLVKWRERVKGEFQKKYGIKLTYMPIFIEAACKALRDFPMINISVDGYKIIKKDFVNIGMATALPDGNLIVPVIKQADEKNLAGLAREVTQLAHAARTNQLKPDDVQASTFSITNVGSFGNITGTPIINQPEAAILAVGIIRKKPAVIETPEGDTIGIRHLMIMSMSYDHRAIDGALGGSFLKRVGDYLENFDTSRTV